MLKDNTLNNDVYTLYTLLTDVGTVVCEHPPQVSMVCVFCHGGLHSVLTVSLCTDEAGGGAVKEGEKTGHSQADVHVGWPQVKSGEPWELNLQNVLWSDFDIGHLHRNIVVKLSYTILIIGS